MELKYLYGKQVDFQKDVEAIAKGFELPFDDPIKFQYHMTAMVEELGEVLKADKRWKTHRNESHDPEEKLDELSDVFITLMNVCIWSGIDADTIAGAVDHKIGINKQRLSERRNSI